MKIALAIFLISKLYDKLTEKYKNKCLIRYFIGLPGKGKTTLATKICIKEGLRKNRKVYSNFEVFGAYKLDMKDFGRYDLRDCILLLDEIGLEFNNRDFKTFSKDTLRFFKLHRHFNTDIYCFSQALDSDISIFRLVDELYIIEKVGRVFSIAKKIDRYLVLHNSKDEKTNNGSENFITEDFKYSFPTNWIITFIPRWVKFFNSFETPKLPKKELNKFEFVNLPYLFKLTHGHYYILDTLRDIYNDLKHKYNVWKHGFTLDFNYLNNYVVADYVKINVKFKRYWKKEFLSAVKTIRQVDLNKSSDNSLEVQ